MQNNPMMPSSICKAFLYSFPIEPSWWRYSRAREVFPDSHSKAGSVPPARLNAPVEVGVGSASSVKGVFDLQHEIDASADGDTIWVEPGTYFGNFDFRGKAVVVKSEEGPKETVLDATWWGSVVTFNSGEDTTSVLDGFTLTHGIGTGPYFNRDGGGIYCVDSSPNIINNIITGNRTSTGVSVESNDGGGIYIRN